VFGRLYFLKKQPGHAEFISASHQDGYPIYRQFIAKHVFYFASEMPICIGMTPHFISRPCWCRHQQAAMPLGNRKAVGDNTNSGAVTHFDQ
jgi:hypothetical protein